MLRFLDTALSSICSENHSVNAATQGGIVLKEISRGDAALIFRKFEDDGASVLCVGILWGWRVVVRGKVSVRDEMNEVALILDDRRGALVLRLDEDDSVFWYSEPGKMPLPERDAVPEEARDSACVSVALPLRVRPSVLAEFSEVPPRAPSREKLFFLEIREGAGR
jgi:hypothetical protein